MALFKRSRETSDDKTPETASVAAGKPEPGERGLVSGKQQRLPTVQFASEGPYRSSKEQLWHGLVWVEQLVRAQAVRWRHTIAANKPQQMWGMIHVTDAEVDAYLATPFMAPEQLSPLLEQRLEPYWRCAAEVLEGMSRRRDETPADIDLRLDQLKSLFQLDTLDLAVLLVCLLPALDGRYRRLYGYLQDDASRTRPAKPH